MKELRDILTSQSCPYRDEFVAMYAKLDAHPEFYDGEAFKAHLMIMLAREYEMESSDLKKKARDAKSNEAMVSCVRELKEMQARYFEIQDGIRRFNL